MMPTLREIRRALRMLVRPARADHDLREELESHLVLAAEKHAGAGATPRTARMRAERDFGQVGEVRDALRGVHSLGVSGLVDRWRTDARYAVRSLLRSPTFTLGVVASLALGLAANATMVGLVDRLLLRPPAHVTAAERLGRVYISNPYARTETPTIEMSYLRYTELADGVRGSADLAAMSATNVVVGRGLNAQRVPGMLVTPSFFSVLGVQPALGRFFSAAEGTPPSGAAVMVIGYGLWQRMFGGRADAIGAHLQLGTTSFTIVGVAPPGFSGAGIGTVDVWVPTTAVRTIYEWLPPQGWYRQHNFGWVEVIGRRAPNISAAALGEMLTRAYAASRAAAGQTQGSVPKATFAPIQLDRGPLRSEIARVATWLAAVSVALLLIVCANVANLGLVRALRRRREIAVRIALGVSRRRLVGQLLVESIVLALLGAVVAIALSVWTSRAAATLVAPDSATTGVIDLRVAGVTLAISLVVGILTGLVPAIFATRADVASSLKAGAREGGYQRSLLRSTLIGIQAAASVVLLVGAGLFVRSLHQVRLADMGFDTSHTILVQGSTRGEDIGSRRLYDVLEERARALPYATHVSRVQSIPFADGYQSDFSVPGVDSASARGHFYLGAVEPDYFAAMGTKILRGRGFTAADKAGAPLVVVVSERMARLLWPGKDALGQCIRIGGDSLPCSTVIGIARDARRNGVRPEDNMQYYTADAQRQPNTGAAGLIVRVAGDPEGVAEPMRRELQRVVPGAVYVRVRTVASLVAPSVRPWRLGAAAFGVFGALALIIAAVGLYSVIAYNVAQRQHEMGVRLALGAQTRHVVSSLLDESMRASVVGLATGALLTLAAGKQVAPLLFETSPRDPMVFGVVLVALGVVAAMAGLFPARRATRIDPAIALRGD